MVFLDQPARSLLWHNGQRTPLDPPAGFTSSTAYGLNDRGQVVGVAARPGTVPVLWDRGSVRTLETTAGTPAQANDINNSGLVAGTIGFDLVTWLDGRIVERFATERLDGDAGLSVPPHVARLNERGQVVGSVTDPITRRYHAVLWHNGTLVRLPEPPGTVTSHASAINDLGQIVGTISTDQDATRAVTWDQGRVTLLPLPAGTSAARALAINDQGQIVGHADDHAVVWHNDAVVDLGTFGGDDPMSIAAGINNDGQITGWSTRKTGTVYREHAVVWSANPNATVLGNAGFESVGDRNGTPDDWSAEALASRSSAARRSGSASLRLQSISNRDVTVWQPIYDVRPNTSVDVGGWVNIPPTGDQFEATIAVAWKDGVGTQLRVDTIKRWRGATSGWNQGTARLVAPPRTDRAVVRISATSLAATVYVDDIVFQPR